MNRKAKEDLVISFIRDRKGIYPRDLSSNPPPPLNSTEARILLQDLLGQGKLRVDLNLKIVID